MRRALLTLSVLAAAALATPFAALAQTQSQNPGSVQDRLNENAWDLTPPPLADRANAGPCPYVKILYDAARYLEFAGDRPTAAGVVYTGEIEEVAAECTYREDEPISVSMDILFHLGRGPQADSAQRTYRYWVAVTDRNTAVLAKQYFDLPVDFGASDRVYVTEEFDNLVIPRASQTVSGSNFEILIGFEVTPAMIELNRTGSRFRIDAGVPGQP